MAQPPPTAIAAIDLGSSAVTTVVGERSDHGYLHILGVGAAPAGGIEAGQISHVARAAQSIATSVEQAQRSAGREILSAGIALTGAHIESLNNRGVAAIPSLDTPIQDDDLRRAIDAGRAVTLDPSRTLIHAIPRFYLVDSLNRVLDPRGMHGQRLDVEIHLVTASQGSLQNAVHCVEQAGINVELIASQAVVSAAHVVRPDEAEQGVVVVDLGAGTTDIVAYAEGAIAHTSSLPVGGNHITRDLSIGLRCSPETAEAAKRQYGQAVPELIAPDPAPIELVGFSEGRTHSVSRVFLSEIVRDRIVEIVALLLDRVAERQLHQSLAGGVVLTGGGSQLLGVDMLFEALTGSAVRVAAPGGVYGLSDRLGDGSSTAAVGLLDWMLDGSDVTPRSSYAGRQSPSGVPAVGAVARGLLNFARVFNPN